MSGSGELTAADLLAQAPPLLVLGCGYSGAYVAALRRESGARVVGTARSSTRLNELRDGGLEACSFDESDCGALSALRFDTAVDVVVSLPPARSEPHHGALRVALDSLSDISVRHAVYLSSTSVYGHSMGATVDETTAISPADPRGERRVAAEALIREWGAARRVSVDILRLPGICGPHRTPRARLQSGRYVLPEGGRVWSNRIYVSDIATATEHLFRRGGTGEDWIATDGRPFIVRDHIKTCCELLGLPMPPDVPLASLDPYRRAFWQGNRRLDPSRLRDSGWEPAVVGCRAMMTDAWAAENATGDVDNRGRHS